MSNIITRDRYQNQELIDAVREFLGKKPLYFNPDEDRPERFIKRQERIKNAPELRSDKNRSYMKVNHDRPKRIG